MHYKHVGGIYFGGSHLLQVDKVGNRSPSLWSQARNRGRSLDIVAGEASRAPYHWVRPRFRFLRNPMPLQWPVQHSVWEFHCTARRLVPAEPRSTSCFLIQLLRSVTLYCATPYSDCSTWSPATATGCSVCCAYTWSIRSVWALRKRTSLLSTFVIGRRRWRTVATAERNSEGSSLRGHAVHCGEVTY
jgi:hypothetical protein